MSPLFSSLGRSLSLIRQPLMRYACPYLPTRPWHAASLSGEQRRFAAKRPACASNSLRLDG